MVDPFLEVGIEQRLASLYSAADDLKAFAERDETLRIMCHSRCKQDLVEVRDQLTKIITQVERG